MDQLLNQIVVDIAQNAVTLIATAVFAYLTVLINKYVKSTTAKFHLQNFNDIVQRAVLATNQTYTDYLKETGEWSKENFEKAYQLTLDSVKKQMTPELEKFLKEASADVNKTINDEIQAQVRKAKEAQDKIKADYEMNRP